MKINVLFFGITTDLIGNSNLAIEVATKITVLDFKVVLKNRFPQLKNIDSYAIAVNEEYAKNELQLKENDVVAIIPPVSGG